MIAEIQAGPRQISDGAVVAARGSKDGAVVSQDAHGRYYEAVARGNVWVLSTPTAGITITANMLVSVASANAIVGLYNPTTNYNFHIIRAVVAMGSNATSTGAVWGTIGTSALLNPLPTGVQRAKNALNLVIGGHRAKAFDGSVAVSGTGVTDLFRTIVAGIINNPMTVQELDNDLVVGPGAFAGIFGDTTTTSAVIRACISWEEIPA